MHICLYLHTHVCVYTYMYMCTQTYEDEYMCTSKNIHVYDMYINVHKYTSRGKQERAHEKTWRGHGTM